MGTIASSEKVYIEEKHVLYWVDQSSKGRIKISRLDLIRHDEPSEQSKEGPPSFVLHKSSFASVSTVRRGHPCLASLAIKNPDFFRDPNSENSLGPVSNPDSIVDTMSLKTDQ